MLLKRVFKTKTFGRWAKKRISDAALCQAAAEIEAGYFEADLGGGLCKKRIATRGHGKSGSTRTLVAKKNALAIVFLVGREKSAPGSDFSEEEEVAAKFLANLFEKADATKLNQLAHAGSLIEICANGGDSEKPS